MERDFILEQSVRSDGMGGDGRHSVAQRLLEMQRRFKEEGRFVSNSALLELLNTG